MTEEQKIEEIVGRVKDNLSDPGGVYGELDGKVLSYYGKAYYASKAPIGRIAIDKIQTALISMNGKASRQEAKDIYEYLKRTGRIVFKTL